MQVYLPIAEMAISAESIFMVSAFVGFLSGLFGIGGGFLTTPFLIFTGVPPAIAVGTQPCQIVANGTSGVLGHLRKGHVDFKMGGFMLMGSTAGSVIGISIFKLLQYLGQIDFVISVLYVVLLSSIGTLMLAESAFSMFFKKKNMRSEFNTNKISNFKAALPFKTRFSRSNLYISAVLPVGVGFIGGILASILGIGGGFLLVPAMIYIIGMPTLVVAGTSLFQIIFTTSISTMLHAVTNNTVDALLAAILIAGGVIGAQVGVLFTGKIRPLHARIMLALLIIIVSIQLSGNLFIAPEEIFSTVVRGGH
ncbi:MAG: sulfite exporter TauE/SafE family protein [Alphaproteobacteria bacterium]|nr:sulfite exporter TauE/SafE family protein [Alphaproteobacteria bacterium]